MLDPVTRYAGNQIRNLCTILWLLSLMLVASPSVSLAGDGCSEDQKITGAITAIDVSLQQITIESLALQINSDTVLEDQDGGPITITMFAVGDLVEAEYCPDSGTPPIAEKIKLDDSATPSPTTSPSPSPSPTPTATGTRPTPTPTASVTGPTSTPTPTGTPDDDDDDRDCEQQIESIVSAVDPAAGTLIVGGVLVRTDSLTEFEDRDSNPIYLVDISVGNRVEAEGCFLDDRSLLAAKVELKSSSITATPTATGTPGPTATPTPTRTIGTNNDCGQEIESFVLEVNAESRTMVIGGVLVLTDSRTRFEDDDDDDTVLRFEDFTVGTLAKAEGCFRADGSLLARKIEREDDDDVSPTITASPTATPIPGTGDRNCGHEIENIVESTNLDAATLTIRGILVRTDSRTVFEEDADDDDVLISLSQIDTGDYAEAEGCFQSDGSLLAKKVEVKRRAGASPTPTPIGTPRSEIELYGVIAEIDLLNNLLIVSGVPFSLDSSTRVTADDDDTSLPLSTLRAGLRVEVKAALQGDGSFLARRIEIKEENEDLNDDDDARDQKAIGVVESLALPGSMVVGGQAIDLSSNPTVTSFDDLPSTLGALTVGSQVKVEGSPLSSGAILARRIEIRASVISSVVTAESAFFVGSTRVAVTAATELRDRSGEEILFSDFSVGDLVKIEGSTTASGITAREVTLLSGVTFSPPIGDFTPTEGAVVGGTPQLTSGDSTNTFGFVDLPGDAFAGGAGLIYEVQVRVSTDVTDRTLVPELRLRSNLAGLERGSFLVVTSTEDGRFSPTVEGKLYHAYFVPALGGAAPNWFSTMDLLNFLGTDDEGGRLRLESISVNALPLSSLRVAESLYEASFSTDDDGWDAVNAEGTFTVAPALHDGEAGAISLAAADDSSFGFWTANTGVAPRSDAIYRGRFLVRFASADRSLAPTIRARLNLSNFQMAAGTVIESVGTAAESPSTTSRIYDVYLRVPGQAADGVTLLASFDLLNFLEGNAINSPVSLEHFTLERLVLER